MRGLCRAAWIGLLLSALLLAAAWAAGLHPWTARTHVVRISDFTFEPGVLQLDEGDTVRWTVISGAHSTTSASGLWDSPDMRTGRSYERRFTEPGSFAYYCRIHDFMRGRLDIEPIPVLHRAAWWTPLLLAGASLGVLAFARRPTAGRQ